MRKGRKRDFILYIVGIILLCAFSWCVQMLLYMQEEEENIKFAYQMLGEMEAGNSYELAAANLLKGVRNEEAVERGLRIMSAYGYDADYQSVFKGRMKAYAVRLGMCHLVFGLLLIVLSGYIYGRIEERHKSELYVIRDILEDFYNEDYTFQASGYKEDIMSFLMMRLESLGRRIALNEERMMTEKEETKALITDLSHQLKTPVASISTCYALLEDESLRPEERTEFLNRLGIQIQHLKGLMSSLFNISRMESGIIAIQKEEADIFQTVVKAVNQVYTKAEEKGIEISLEESGDTVESLVLPHDVKWTKEAIVNVLDNAVKYSPAGSKVWIVMERWTHFLRIEIRDEGIGIPKAEANRVFQRFYRGGHEVVRNTEGSGVGLYLARKILEEQGGSITVVYQMGQEKSNGTTFAIMLSLK